MSTIKKNILIFVHIPAHFKEMLRVARLLKLSVNYNPIILFKVAYEGYTHDKKICDEIGIEYIDIERGSFEVETSDLAITPKIRKRNSILRTLKKSFKHILFGLKISDERVEKIFAKKPLYFKLLATSVDKFVHLICLLMRLLNYKSPFKNTLISKYFMEYDTLPDFFKKYQVNLIILPEDNIFYLTPLLVRIAKQNHIETIVIPFTIANSKEWAESFFPVKSMHVNNVLNTLVGFKYPHWTYLHKNKRLILPAGTVIAYEYLGLRPSIPWLMNSGDVSAIAVESNFMKKYYLDSGLRNEKLKITGALYDDIIYERQLHKQTYLANLYKSLKIENDLPMLLCALPPNQCLSDRHDCEFREYQTLLRFWLSTLEKCNHRYNIVINLHPRIKKEEIEFINEYNVTLAPFDIANLVPLADVYVASCSATIRMAIGCGIPVINYDVYRYHYNDYDEAKGVFTIELAEEFESAVSQLIKDPQFYQRLHKSQQECKEQWCMMDGCSSKRLLELIDHYAN